MNRRKLAILLGALLAAAIVVAALVFKPWLLFVDVRVDETLPVAVSPEPSVVAPTASAPPEVPVQLSAGTFTSHEHDTSGTVRIVQNPDGSRVLAIENLDTSNGPDVHVWLSAADVVEGTDGWYLAGSAGYLDLGPLKGNLGNQLYDIPADTDLGDYRSVALWCVQFSVSFGAAQLA